MSEYLTWVLWVHPSFQCSLLNYRTNWATVKKLALAIHRFASTGSRTDPSEWGSARSASSQCAVCNWNASWCWACSAGGVCPLETWCHSRSCSGWLDLWHWTNRNPTWIFDSASSACKITIFYFYFYNFGKKETNQNMLIRCSHYFSSLIWNKMWIGF